MYWKRLLRVVFVVVGALALVGSQTLVGPAPALGASAGEQVFDDDGGGLLVQADGTNGNGGGNNGNGDGTNGSGGGNGGGNNGNGGGNNGNGDGTNGNGGGAVGDGGGTDEPVDPVVEEPGGDDPGDGGPDDPTGDDDGDGAGGEADEPVDPVVEEPGGDDPGDGGPDDPTGDDEGSEADEGNGFLVEDSVEETTGGGATDDPESVVGELPVDDPDDPEEGHEEDEAVDPAMLLAAATPSVAARPTFSTVTASDQTDGGLSGSVRRALAPVLPPALVAVVVSPFVIIQALGGALASSGLGLALPASLLVLGLAGRRSRHRLLALGLGGPSPEDSP
jgi:hypothetical protein